MLFRGRTISVDFTLSLGSRVGDMEGSVTGNKDKQYMAEYDLTKGMAFLRCYQVLTVFWCCGVSKRVARGLF
ncbi:hypothetical protein Csa_017576 [Cucumis sativus]|uniref:Uncharacterized protein n=1 Tax=Cucumis sativus TaxID=3659 RepID=A0A0A0LE15_CUCSA|nr:hypothetical protein Csa_017576 [Cucumis sativus]